MRYSKVLAAFAGALALATVAGGTQAAPAGALKAANVENASAVEKVHGRRFFFPRRHFFVPHHGFFPRHHFWGPRFGFGIGFGPRHWWW
jgi:hypothetical protein